MAALEFRSRCGRWSRWPRLTAHALVQWCPVQCSACQVPGIRSSPEPRPHMGVLSGPSPFNHPTTDHPSGNLPSANLPSALLLLICNLYQRRALEPTTSTTATTTTTKKRRRQQQHHHYHHQPRVVSSFSYFGLIIVKSILPAVAIPHGGITHGRTKPCVLVELALVQISSGSGCR